LFTDRFDRPGMDPALRRRLDAALVLLTVIAFAAVSTAFSPGTAIALALLTGTLGAVAWDTVRTPASGDSQ
jgi:chromate transport protein ChrA